MEKLTLAENIQVLSLLADLTTLSEKLPSHCHLPKQKNTVLGELTHQQYLSIELPVSQIEQLNL
jgi:hypothetical protein